MPDTIKFYIDDLVEGMFDLMEEKEQHCEFDGVETVAKEDGRYCYVPVTHKVTLGEIVELLQQFKEQPTTLMMPKMPEGSFANNTFRGCLTLLNFYKEIILSNAEYYGSSVPLFRRNGYRQSGTMAKKVPDTIKFGVNYNEIQKRNYYYNNYCNYNLFCGDSPGC